MDSSKANIVYVDPVKNIADMTDDEIREQVAEPLYRELSRQRDAVRHASRRDTG